MNTIKLFTGPLFTKKTPSYVYRDPHDKPKTVWRPSQVYNGNPAAVDRCPINYIFPYSAELYSITEAG